MLKVIKSAQFKEVVNGDITDTFLDNKYDQVCKKLDTVQNTNLDVNVEEILNEAKLQARKIVDVAQNYILYYMKTTSQRISEEYELVTSQSYNEGFKLGLEEGEKKGVEIGKKEGFKAGYEEGLEAAKAEIESEKQAIREVLLSIEKGRDDFLNHAKSDIEQLSIAVSKAIVKKEFELNPNAMHTMIENTIDTYKAERFLKILLSTNCYNSIANIENSIVNKVSNLTSEVKFVCDPTLSDTDCIIETPTSVLDAGVETQLDNIEKALNFQQ